MGAMRFEVLYLNVYGGWPDTESLNTAPDRHMPDTPRRSNSDFSKAPAPRRGGLTNLEQKHMNQLFTRHSSILALTLAFAAASAQAMPPAAQAPESGRWITQSGNLEIEIAPCGEALCGTVVRVISNGSMSGSAAPAPMAAAPAPSALGAKILFDLRPVANGGFQGRIYNRGDQKMYNSLVVIAAPNELKLTIYEDTPAKGQVQVWRRAGSAK